MLNNLLVAQAAIAGALLPIQAVLNAAVGRSLGHPLSAAVVNFIVGLIGLAALATVLRVPLPQFGNLGPLPWYYGVGGGSGRCVLCLHLIVCRTKDRCDGTPCRGAGRSVGGVRDHGSLRALGTEEPAGIAWPCRRNRLADRRRHHGAPLLGNAGRQKTRAARRTALCRSRAAMY